MNKRIFFSLLVPSTLCGWSLTETVSDATSTVSGWFTKQQTQASSKEYAIKTNSHITIKNNDGNITITTWNKPAIMVEATKRGAEEAIKNTSFSVNISADEQNVTINTEARSDKQKTGALDYAIIMPRSAPLTIRSENGNIRVQDHKANLDVQTLNGSIAIEQSAKNVKAKAPHGSITVAQNELKNDSSIFLEAERDITLVIPEDANTNLNIHTVHGKITSDTIFVTLDPITTKLNKESFKRMQQNVRGTTGAGGIPITLETMKGNITILGS